jgi:hypothetical protein
MLARVPAGRSFARMPGSGVAASPAPVPDIPLPGDMPSVPAAAGSFGFIDYSDTDTSAFLLQANVRTWIVRSAPTAINRAQPPYDVVTLWNGAIITPRAPFDTMAMRLDLDVTPAIWGGYLRMDIDVGGVIGATNTVEHTISGDAGTLQRVSFQAFLESRASIMAHGGKIHLTASVPMTITDFSPIFYPWSKAP